MIEPGLLEPGLLERDLVERGPVQPATSDSAVADLEQSGWGWALRDGSLPDFVADVSGMRLPSAGMRLQRKEEKSAGPERDYSEGA